MTKDNLDEIVSEVKEKKFQGYTTKLKIKDTDLPEYLEEAISPVVANNLIVKAKWDQDSTRLAYIYITNIDGFPYSVTNLGYKVQEQDKALCLEISCFSNLYRYLNCSFNQKDERVALSFDDNLVGWEEVIPKVDKVMSEIEFVRVDNTLLKMPVRSTAESKLKTYEDFLFSYI